MWSCPDCKQSITNNGTCGCRARHWKMKPVAQEFEDTGGDTPENSFIIRNIVAVDNE